MFLNSDVVKEQNARSLSHFNPLLILFRFFGIELNPLIKLTRNQKCFKSLIEFVVFSLHVFAHMLFTVLSLKIMFYERKPQNSTIASNSVRWNSIIDFFNFFTLAIGVHALILNLVHRNEWRLLHQNLHKATEEQDYSKPFRSDCRRAVFFGIVLLLLVHIRLNIFRLSLVKRLKAAN